MGKHKKRRKRMLAAVAERLINVALDILSAIVAGLITAAIARWLKW